LKLKLLLHKKFPVSFILSLIIGFSVFPQSKKESYQLKIGSKKFTENVILGEIATQLARLQNSNVKHLKELGGTRILWNALLKGDIDVYPEYTGTLKEEILAGQNISDDESLKKALNKMNINISKSLGFNDTYAIGMKKSLANKLHIKTISDLKDHPELRLGFSNEFMDRKDGWPGLRNRYNLPQKNVLGLDHDLAYRGLDNGSIDVIDFYSTDAEIEYYILQVLKDDLNYFPEYKAVFVYRSELESKSPKSLKSILRLEENVPESTMIKMNAEVKINKTPETIAASELIKQKFSIKTNYEVDTFFERIWLYTKEHLFLVLISLIAAIITSIPLGIFAFKNQKFANVILGITGIIQTIPSLALLVFMIPLLGIGSSPAILALFLYSLLPIVRNTYSGLIDIPVQIKESAEALGISPFARLRLIELPLASRSILAGIKTSAVINVGTATLGALIGAGGYGQPILTGIRLDNIPLILEGAVPAAILALAVQALFDVLELFLVPRGLRMSSNN
jgi:osmoprotectant transport system substrate-binding protein/osmoprotectant transport system permease protein